METTHTPPVPTKTWSNWIGHLLTVLATATAGGVGYGTIESRISEMERRISILENDVIDEIREVKQEVSDVRVRLAEMGQDIRWLKDREGK